MDSLPPSIEAIVREYFGAVTFGPEERDYVQRIAAEACWLQREADAPYVSATSCDASPSAPGCSYQWWR